MGTRNIAALANCKRCQRMHMRPAQPYCADCAELRLVQRNLIYKGLQHYGLKTGVLVEDLSLETGVGVEDIEAFFFEGQLGTMADALLFSCGTCRQPMRLVQRNGRLCVACSRTIAEKTGVRIRSYNQLEQEANAPSSPPLKPKTTVSKRKSDLRYGQC